MHLNQVTQQIYVAGGLLTHHTGHPGYMYIAAGCLINGAVTICTGMLDMSANLTKPLTTSSCTITAGVQAMCAPTPHKHNCYLMQDIPHTCGIHHTSAIYAAIWRKPYAGMCQVMHLGAYMHGCGCRLHTPHSHHTSSSTSHPVNISLEYGWGILRPNVGLHATALNNAGAV